MPKYVAEFIVAVTATIFTTLIFYEFSVFQTKIIIPPDAVVAFESEICPQGWSQFSVLEDRFIIGASKEHKLNNPGGAAAITLTIPNIPPHKHDAVLGIQVGREAPTRNGADALGSSGGGTVVQTGSAGGTRDGKAEPIDILPPFYALTFCKKSG